MQIATIDPRSKGIIRSTLGVRFKVTRGLS